jgi:hypothetical protein
MASNLPPGTTQAMIDRYYGDDQDFCDSADEQDLEEAYLDALEQQAEQLPGPVFHELEPVEIVFIPRKPAGVQLNLFQEREVA